jgi:ankyrin repeat protein
MSCLHGHVPAVKALIGGGVDILAANAYGQLPIHDAVSYGKSAVSKCLFQQFYATALHLPLHNLVEDLTWIGYPYSSDVPPLRPVLDENVLGTNVVEIIELLVDQNPEFLSSHDQNDSLPLHAACRRGTSFAIVQSLVNRSAAGVLLAAFSVVMKFASV